MTRFYFPSSGNAPNISPAFDAGWEQTGEADRLILIPKLLLDVATSRTGKQITVPITTTQDILARQFVSGPIPPTNFKTTDTISAIVRCVESATTINASLAIVVKIVSQDGSIVRGTLYSNFNIDSEFPASGSDATRIMNSVNISALQTLPGDRIVIEVGVHAAAPSAGGTASVRFGNNSTSGDFAMTSGLTTDLNPWFEMSKDLWATVFNNQQFVKVGDGMSTGEKIR